MLTIKAGNYTLATYEYAGNNGKLLKLTYGNGNVEEYVYDNLERLVSTKLNGVNEYTVKYDNNGRLSTLTEGGRTHSFQWLDFERLKDEYFYPLFLKQEIFNLPEEFTLRTEHE